MARRVLVLHVMRASDELDYSAFRVKRWLVAVRRLRRRVPPVRRFHAIFIGPRGAIAVLSNSVVAIEAAVAFEVVVAAQREFTCNVKGNVKNFILPPVSAQ